MSREMRVLGDAPAWKPVSTASLVGVALFATLLLVLYGRSEDGWVPVLDGANLLIHEAGHPLVGILSNRLMVYGGTIFQLLFPALTAFHFARQEDAPGTAAGVIWLGESLLNVARYMADARPQVLPLVGGGEHDWTEIFSRWGVLHLDGRIAGFTRFMALVLILGAVAWLFRRWQQGDSK